jgi:hypothetical protein
LWPKGQALIEEYLTYLEQECAAHEAASSWRRLADAAAAGVVAFYANPGFREYTHVLTKALDE